MTGCINGTGIPITAPPHNEADYVNRNSAQMYRWTEYFSVEIICDVALTITSEEAKWPGTVDGLWIH